LLYRFEKIGGRMFKNSWINPPIEPGFVKKSVGLAKNKGRIASALLLYECSFFFSLSISLVSYGKAAPSEK
jgi:hypothetical protein